MQSPKTEVYPFQIWPTEKHKNSTSSPILMRRFDVALLWLECSKVKHVPRFISDQFNHSSRYEPISVFCKAVLNSGMMPVSSWLNKPSS